MSPTLGGRTAHTTMDARLALIQTLFPLFYEVTPTGKRWVSSYGMKHDLEYGLFQHPDKFYFSNDETITALVALGIPHRQGDPNYGFRVKEKFPVGFLRANVKTRPKYGKKTEWEAYLHARKEMDALVDDLIKDTDPKDSRFTRLAKVIGYEGQAVKEVPASLTARLTSAQTTASGSP